MARSPLFSWVPSLSFLFLIFAIGLQPFTALRLRGSITLADCFMFAAIIALLPPLLRSRVRVWMPWWLVLSSALLIFACLIRIVTDWGAHAHFDLVNVIIFCYCIYLIPVVIASQPDLEVKHLNLIIMVWVFSHLISAIVAIGQSYGVNFGISSEYFVVISNRYAGLTLNPNSLGMFLAFCVPMVISAALFKPHLKRYVAGLFIASILLYGINLTGSRTALLSSIIASGLTALIYMFSGRTSTMLTQAIRLLIVMATASAFWVYISDSQMTAGAFERLLKGDEGTKASDVIRDELGAQALRNFLENPFSGIGFIDVINAHNVWVMLLEGSGVLGFTAIVIRELGLIATLLSGINHAARSSPLFLVLAGCLGSLAAWGLEGIKETMLFYRDGPTIQGIGVLAAILVAKSRSALQAPAHTN